MAKYHPGQRWSYRKREQDVGSTLLIGKVQKGLLKPSVIHVMVDGIVSPDSADPIVIGHMPFSKKAIDASVLELIEKDVRVSPEFEDAFATWRKQKGGVFDLTVSEAVDAALSMAPPSRGDPFDAIVAEMRSGKSEELIEELYRQLFSLGQWFFLCEPDNPRVPVQWKFSDGMNPTPALLAFTSPERAAAAAVSLGICPEGSDVSVMPAPVRDSVRWISGPDCANDWLCFNLTQQDFPLYCDDAVRLFENMGRSDFVPPEDKAFSYKEGDLLAQQNDEGIWQLMKILRVDRVDLRKGDSIRALGQAGTAPADDHLLVVSVSCGEDIYKTLDDLKSAVREGTWKVKIGHVPIRAGGLNKSPVVHLGNEAVAEEELGGYRQWKEAFDKGKAGIF